MAQCSTRTDASSISIPQNFSLLDAWHNPFSTCLFSSLSLPLAVFPFLSLGWVSCPFVCGNFARHIVQEFKTEHGRVVRDGGGIDVDVVVRSPQPSELENALQNQGMFFYFANIYAADVS